METANPAAPAREGAYVRLLAVVVAAVALLFLGSTVATERSAQRIEREIATLRENSLPSISTLGAARAALRQIDWATAIFAGASGELSRYEREVARARANLDLSLAEYLALPGWGEERAQYPEVQQRLRTLDAALDDVRRTAREKPEAITEEAQRVNVAVESADELLERLMEVNGTEAAHAADAVEASHHTAVRAAMALDALCVLLAVAAFALGAAAARRSMRLAVEEVRARELELFAQRVAHDLLSPLTSLTYALSPLKRPGLTEERAKEVAARASACVQRAHRLVRGIFDYARAGATPAPDAKCGVAEVLAGVLEDAETNDEQEALELTVEPFDDFLVACSPGVLTSMLSNLVTNAIKYTRGNPRREVVVRVERAGDVARFVVEDSGRGLPIGFEAQAFEPYRRAPDTDVPGLGLGLATVKRLAESHGGRVGYRTGPRGGALFWFELPLASGAGVARSDAPRPSPALH